MIDFIKDKIHSLALTVASSLVALQIIMPTMIDAVLGAIIVGVMWIATKIGKGETN